MNTMKKVLTVNMTELYKIDSIYTNDTSFLTTPYNGTVVSQNFLKARQNDSIKGKPMQYDLRINLRV